MLQESSVQPPSALVRQWLFASARQMASGKSFISGGIETAHRHLARSTDGRCVLSVEDPSRFGVFGAGELRLGETAIRLLTCESVTSCSKSTHRPPERDHVILQCVLNGSLEVIQGNRHVLVSAGQALITGSVGDTTKRWRGASALMNIVMPQETLRHLLATEYAADEPPDWRFGRLDVIELGSVASLAHFVGAIVSDLSDKRPVFRAGRVAQQAEQALHLLVLKSLIASQRDGVEPVSSAVPFYVRRAEAFLGEHLAEPLTLGGLAEATGVSPRTLQYGFRTYRNTTPMEALRQIRLAAAREALLAAPATGLRVGEIAKRCGYISLSHFSREYRACYGESPSETVSVQ